jgi:glycosyltransferase involved in cell wall biosynthesis
MKKLESSAAAPAAKTAPAAAPSRTRVCLVTEELAGIAGSGGIGAAFLELAQLLANSGALVDVLYCPIAGSVSVADQPKLAAKFADQGIKLNFLDASPWVPEPLTYEKKAYAVARQLLKLEADRLQDGDAAAAPYDFIHFHDYKGLGCFATSLKRQGLGFAATDLVVQLHGPTRWTIEANQSFFSHEDQLKIDHMERLSIAQADRVVSPSAYLVDWLKGHGFKLPADTRVIKNVCSGLSQALHHFRPRLQTQTQTQAQANVPAPVTDLVFFARHEDRKGFAVFCDALEKLNDELAEAKVTVTFLGKMGRVDSQPSGVYLIDRASKWRFPVRVRSGFARNEAAQYLQSLKRPVVVIPSPAENSPYTVLESIMLGMPVISSLDGGGPELFADPHYAGLCTITGADLAGKISTVLAQGLDVPVPAETSAQIDQHWLAFHAPAPVGVKATATKPAAQPRVTLAITHHERPKKLVDAILSAVCQTYANTEILVVDDGSTSESTVAALQQVEALLRRVGGRLVRQENAYLGAARNTAIREAQGDYVVFLDDDDVAFPDLVQTLVTAAVSTGADAVTCLNIFMEESIRGEALARTNKAPRKVTYVPLAGPLALAPTENCIGAATAIFRKKSVIEVGGYSEIKGVGHEDYELYIRLLQAGKQVGLVPLPLYFYEVGRPSMLSRTSLSKNFRRCFDVVDLKQNPATWRDVLSLNVGKNVAVHSHNRQWWLYSLQKTAGLRHRLLSEPLDRAATLNTLIELAGQEGATRLQSAFAQDLKQAAPAALPDEAEELLDFESPLDGTALSRAAERPIDPTVTELRIELALGRVEAAVRTLTHYLTDFRAVDADVLQLTRQLVHTPQAQSIAARDWKALATALRATRVAKADRPALTKAAVLVSLLAADATAVAALLRPELQQAERQYLALHADVGQAVRDGALPSGLDHFLACGMDEGRTGFDVLLGLVSFARGNGQHHATVQAVLALLQTAGTERAFGDVAANTDTMPTAAEAIGAPSRQGRSTAAA